MKRGVVIGLSVVGGLLVLLLISPFLIPASAFKSPIEKAVADATGREFKINDGLRLTYWPVLGVDAKSVTLANAPGGKAQYFMTAENVAIGVAVAPLLKGDIQVRKLVVDKPNIALETNAGGKGNWVFTPKTKPGEPTSAPDAGKPVEVKKLGLADVRIVDGALSYDDGKNPMRTFSDIDMDVNLPDLDKALAIDGELTMNEQRLKVALGAAQPRAFLNKGTTPIGLSIDGEVMKVGLDGAMDASNGAITGALKASGPSLRNLAAWTGSPMGPGNGFQAFDVAGQLAMKDKDIALSKAAIKLDAISGTGDLKINTSQPIPYVSGALNLGALDLNTYMPAPKGGAAPGPVSAKPGDKAAAAAAKPGDKVGGRGVTVQAGWPKDPMDMSGLGKVNMNLGLTTQKLLFQRYKIDSAKLNLHSVDGVMNATLAELQLYGGKGSGVVVLDASKKGRISVAPKIAVQGLNANPFLIDAIGLDKIEGRGNLTLDLHGGGANTDQIMKSLGGAASFKFTDGAVKGINLAQIARTIQGGLSGAATGASAKTDFAEMASTFMLKDGVATTSDFRLLNPYIRVTGKGDMNVGEQTFNMRIEPKLVKSGEGQGATGDVKGLSVPFKMTGPWAKPRFAPDLGDLIKNEASKQLDKLLGKKADGTPNTAADAIGGLLSGFGKKKD